MSGEGKIVCVTGASGYIASWLVKFLLRHGYSVRATVRSLKDPNRVRHLVELEGANERLHLFEANLLIDRSFDVAINGCDGVFHVASPISFSPLATKEELLDPAVKGTLNVLQSCARTPLVKRVVITSSTASVLYTRNRPTPTQVIDETWFSDKDYAEETKQWYILSKTVAEEEAWKFAKEKGIDLVTLHPSMVIGPLLQPTLNFSNSVIVDLIKEGKMSSEMLAYVDIRDVVDAHIKAFEVPSASGRYLLVGGVVHSSNIMKIAHQLYPSFSIPNKFQHDELTLTPTYTVSQEKAKSLGVNFTPFDVSLKDTLESLKEKNFLSF